MAIKFSNLASTTLASGVSDTATSLSVTSASSFPSLGGSDYFYASIGRGSGSEIVKVTALSGTTLTVVRGQDDTTAISHASGVEFALRVTAASLNDLSTQADTESVSIAGDTMTGALTVPALDITGNTTTSGTIDGRDVAADGTKLDGIESGATADQTASEIKAAYESNSDTNAFTDADESKLGGIESGATADQTASEIKTAYESNSDTNAFTDAAESKLSGIEASADVTDTTNVTAAGALMDSEVTNLTQVKAFDSSDYATAAQGTTADDALPKSGGAMTGAITTNSTFDGRDVATDGTKLDGIEANATADQTNAEIRAAVEAASDSNAFTDADHSKLNAIEAGATADQTAAEIKTAYESNSDTNAFTDADHSKLNGIAANANNYVLPSGYATESYVNTQVTNLVDSSPATLNTLNELAAALGDDPNFATTTANSIGTKAALSGAAFTGAITTNSTIDGRDVATDGTKLDGIEASADVTDTANVTAAGALMDGELTAIASVKGLDQGVATTDSPSFVNLALSGTGSVKVPSGTTAQRDGSPVNGMFRYNSSNQQFEGYQSGDWGAIGGGGGSNTFTADTFTANGSTTAYALSQVINSENNLLVFIDGVFQQQSAYSIATASGTTTLTFSTAPANTREIIVYSVASAVSGSNLNTDSMTGDGSDVTLALSIAPVSENNTQVFIDGVYQNKDTYSISGTTLTFSTAPPTGSAVEVMTMTQTEVNVPVDGTITSAKLSGDLTLPGDLSFADNSKALFGAGSDLQIYHDGSSRIANSTGNLIISDTDGDIYIQAKAGENSIKANNDGSVLVYFDNAEKLATTSTGIDVTGDVNTSGLLKVGTNDTEYANNYLRFKPTGAAYIDHSTVGQAINFRVSGSSSLDTNALTINSTGIDVTGTATMDSLTVQQPSGANILLESTTTGATTGDIFGEIEFKTNDSSSAGVKGKIDSYSEGGVGNGALRLFTGNTTGLYERFRIASNGDISFYEDTGTTARLFWDASAERLVIGDNTVSPSGDAGDLVVGGSTGSNGITIGSATTGTGSLRFSDTGGTGRGIVLYDHSSDFMNFHTAGTERMRIDSSGRVGIGTSSPSAKVDIFDSGAGNANSSGLELTNYDYGAGETGQSISIEALVRNDGGGTSPLSKIIFGKDSDYSSAAARDGNIQFYTNQSNVVTEAMRIDSSGQILSTASEPTITLKCSDASLIADQYIGGFKFEKADASGAGAGVVGGMRMRAEGGVGESTYLQFSTSSSSANDTERMRIDASGNLLVGESSNNPYSGLTTAHVFKGASTQGGSAPFGIYSSTGTANVPVLNLLSRDTSTNSTNRFMQFYANVTSTTNTPMGGIVGNGASNVQFATISDVREKTNIARISGSLEKINALNPVEFDWIASGEHVNAGFVAQEVETVFPEFVVENMAGEGAEERKGLTGGMTGGIVAHLVKAIQEQQTLIESLTARIAALEE